MSRLSKALPPDNYTTDEPSFYQQLETRQKVSPPVAPSGLSVTRARYRQNSSTGSILYTSPFCVANVQCIGNGRGYSM